MSTLVICLFITVVLTYLTKLPVGYAMKKAKGGYNNNYPREQQASLTGFGARAAGAHQNGFESLTVFSTAVLTALVTNHLSQTIQILAVVYVIARVVYNIMYLMNWATLRSLVWFISLLCSLIILGTCIS